MTAFTDPVARLRGRGMAPASIGHPMLQASGIGGHSPVSFSATSADDSFSRVSSTRGGISSMGGRTSTATNLQSAMEAMSEGLAAGSNLSAAGNHSIMGILRNWAAKAP